MLGRIHKFRLILFVFVQIPSCHPCYPIPILAIVPAFPAYSKLMCSRIGWQQIYLSYSNNSFIYT